MLAKLLAPALVLAAALPAAAESSCALAIGNAPVGSGQRCEYDAEGPYGTLTLTVTAGAAAASVECADGGATRTGIAGTSQSVTFRRSGYCLVLLVSLVDGTSATATSS